MENVSSAIRHLFDVTDQRDWKQVESSFDSKVLLDYTSVGKDPVWMTPRQIMEVWTGILPGFDRTNHQISDMEIQESQDLATAFYQGKIEHFIEEDVWVVEGSYETTLVKKGAGWLISQFKFNLRDWSGDRQLAAIAIERAKKAS